MAMNGANRGHPAMRIVPNINRLIPDESGNMAMTSPGRFGPIGHGAASDPTVAATFGAGVAALNYEDSDLNSITRSQMTQDLIAYRYDLDFCQTQLTTQLDLSPQELRTLQIRILDCAHNIRHCKHRIQTLDAQARLGIAPYSTGTPGRSGSGSGTGVYRSAGSAAPAGKYKRRRIGKTEGDEVEDVTNDADADADGVDDSIVAVGTDVDRKPSPDTLAHSLQRLGYWDCNLCRSRKFLEAGTNRVPSAPCKWPLKDISKMINHFLDLHTEHTPQERCSELGDALARNRGPFEYWLTRTKGQEIDNTSLIDEYVQLLQSGSLPDAMRGLLRSATMFPNTVSNSYRK